MMKPYNRLHVLHILWPTDPRQSWVWTGLVRWIVMNNVLIPDCGRLALATSMLLSFNEAAVGSDAKNIQPESCCTEPNSPTTWSAKAFPCWLRSGRGRSHSEVEVHNMLLPASERSPTSKREDKCFHAAETAQPTVWTGQNRTNHTAWTSKQWKGPNWQVSDQDRKLYNPSIQRRKRHHQKRRQHREPY